MPPEPVRPSFRAYGCQTIEEALHRALSLTAAVREGADEEAVHDIRVASRRLRAALSVFEPAFVGKEYRQFERQVKRITDSMSRARDLDVMRMAIERHVSRLKPHQREAVEEVARGFARQRARVQPLVVLSLDQLEGARLPERFERIVSDAAIADAAGPDLVLEFGVSIARRLQELMSWDAASGDPRRVQELHQMRIAAKRLRYTLELLPPGLAAEQAEAVERMRVIQTHLGEIHDADVLFPEMMAALRRELKRAAGEEQGVFMVETDRLAGLVAAGDRIRAERASHYRLFSAEWARLKEDALLPRLLEGLYRSATARSAGVEPVPTEDAAGGTENGD